MHMYIPICLLVGICGGLLTHRPHIKDGGFLDSSRGWFDAQCQGATNDYCRYVGDKPNDFWSCALAGGDEDLTAPGMYSEDSTSKVPCCGAGEPQD